jgi:hypothetical protein
MPWVGESTTSLLLGSIKSPLVLTGIIPAWSRNSASLLPDENEAPEPLNHATEQLGIIPSRQSSTVSLLSL